MANVYLEKPGDFGAYRTYSQDRTPIIEYPQYVLSCSTKLHNAVTKCHILFLLPTNVYKLETITRMVQVLYKQ